MPRPTVLQSLLGRPSRTYTDTPPPAPKDYHSVKQNLIQVATQPNVHVDDEDDAYPLRASGKVVQRSRHQVHSSANSSRATSLASSPSSSRSSSPSIMDDGPGPSRVYFRPAQPLVLPGIPKSSHQPQVVQPIPRKLRSSSDSYLGPAAPLASRSPSPTAHGHHSVTVTPPSPVRDSGIPSSTTSGTLATNSSPHAQTDTPVSSSPSATTLRRTASTDSTNSSTSLDEFFTPLTSPAASPHNSISISGPADRLSFSALQAALAPMALSQAASPPSTRSASPSNESVSIFSHSSSTHSTNITTPQSSEYKHSSNPSLVNRRVPGVGPRKVTAPAPMPIPLPAGTRPTARLISSNSDSRIEYSKAARRLTPLPSSSSSSSSLSRVTAPPRAGPSRQRKRHTLSPSEQRMSAVFEDSDEEVKSETHSSQTHDSHRPRHTARRPPHSRTSSASGSTVTALPAPLPASTDAYSASAHGNGYTTLVLPQATYIPRTEAQVARAIASGTVDLARGGLAQTTMATVEIVAGVAQKRLGRSLTFKLKAPFRRPSLSRHNSGRSRSASTDGASIASSSMSFGSEHIDDECTGRALAFTSHVAPPKHVPPNAVLVRVAAVGLDGVDARLTAAHAGAIDGSHSGHPEVGWIPGRSIVGRAVEIGSAVKEDWIRKGEWLVGLLDAQKCGALAEFVLIDRRRLHRTARPRPTHGSLSKTNVSSPLTVEELALLPVAGVPAFRAVRTFTWPNPGSDAPAPRALILQAHDGVGAAAVQLLVERGAVVTAHVPKASTAVDARLRSWGVTHVVPGLPLVVLAEFRGAGATFDFILDTVGGKAIWNVARMLLSNTGGSAIFVTTVGDSPERPIPSSQDHFRAGMRSLGIGPGERPGGYAWVSAAADTDLEGEDVKDALAALLMPTTPRPGQSSSSLALKPWVPVREDERRARVLPFERAPDAFGKEAEGLRMGGTAVITIMD